MIQMWKGPGDRIALSDGFGCGSPGWDYWALLIYDNVGVALRIELDDAESKISRDKKWKLVKTFPNHIMKEIEKTCPTCKRWIHATL